MTRIVGNQVVVLGAKTAEYKLLVGEGRLVPTTIDLNQAAAAYDLYTAATQAVLVKGLMLRMPTGAAGGALTSIAVATDDATPAIFIDSDVGQVANLVSEMQLSWEGRIYLKVGQKIQLTIAGGAHGSAYVVDVVAEAEAVVDGGNLTI